MVKAVGLCAALIAAVLCAPASYAQQGEPIKRTQLQKGDYPAPNMETQLMLIEIVPNAVVPRHTHPGGEVGYVLEGEVEFTIGNAPPKTFKQGESFMIPPKTPHTPKAGPAGAKLLGTFVVEKDQPLASPAP
jgi:quercetin dioxygenase-like cupin family protein